jgi:hypothetical protein
LTADAAGKWWVITDPKNKVVIKQMSENDAWRLNEQPGYTVEGPYDSKEDAG